MVCTYAFKNADGEKVVITGKESFKSYLASGGLAEFGLSLPEIKKSSERDLVITHNLTAANLLHADKMGGLAVPSLAVTKANAPLAGFGEITLIGSKDMADPKGYAKTKMYGADVYSPRYPRIDYKITKSEVKSINDDLGDLVNQYGDGKISLNEISNDPLDELSKLNPVVAAALSEQGIKVDPVLVDGKVDIYKTRYALRKAASDNGLYGIAEEYAKKLLSNAGAEERIFKGYSSSGNRAYMPHTLENVVKILKKEIRGGENFNYGVGSLRAKYTPEFKSIKQIQDQKGRLVSKEDFEKVKKDIDSELVSLINSVNPKMDLSSGIEFLEDVGTFGVDRAMTRFNLSEASPELKNKIVDFLGKLKNLPTEYFEAKILRDVSLSEFSGAVIPKDSTDKVRSILKRNGIPFVEYANDDSRAKAIEDFSNQLDEEKKNIRFSAARNSIPLYEETKSIPDTIMAVSKEPNIAIQSAKELLTAGRPQSEMLESIVTNLFDSDNTLEQIARKTGKDGQKDEAAQKFLDTQKLYKAASQKVVSDAIKEYADPMLETLKTEWKNTYSSMPWYKETGYKQFLNDIGTIGNLVKHGRERNADIAAKTEGKDLAGSGRTNEEIDAIEKDLRKEAPGLIELYEKIYKENLKPMMDIANNAKRESGLLTPEMEAARKNYEWYVPLYGDPSEFEEKNIGTGGSGLKSPKDKKALGRSGTLADNVLENVLKQMSNSVAQAGKQEMKADLIEWIKSSPNAKLAMGAKINDSTTSEIFEKYTAPDGLVHERVKPGAAMSPNSMVYRNGNDTVVVEFSNPKVVESLNGLKPIEGVLSGIQKATRLMGAVFTRYNPIFPVMNKLRDSQSQISFVIADAPVQDKFQAAKDTLANNLKYSTQWGSRESQEYKEWKEKFEKLGGATMYSDVLHDDVMKNIERDFSVAVDNKLVANRMANKIGSVVDAVNEHMEMSSRVAMFKALVDNGMTERQAALYTKNTMNFETKGKWGQQLGALYTFAGPALFDARRMAQSLRTPRGAMVMAAQFGMMFGLYGALKAMGGDDEDGIARLNKIPVNQSGRFLTFIGEDGTGYKIPVGFGYSRIALTLAASLHRYLDGVDDIAEFSQHVAIDGLVSNFSVIEPKDINIKKDAIGWAMQTFLPTVTQPLYQVASNKNFQGAPIHKPDEWTGSKLQFQQSWPNTSQLFKDAAKEIYDATGIDIYPETIAHITRSYGGNGVMDVVRGFQLMGEKADKEWALSDIPALQGFASRASSQDSNRFREKMEELNKLADVRKYEVSQGNGAEFDAEHPNLFRQLSIYKAADKEVKALYKSRKAADTEYVKEINKRIQSVQMRANKAAE